MKALLLAALLSSWANAVEVGIGGGAAPGPVVAQVLDFRRLGGLPELSPATLAALSQSPETLKAARLEAAQALLGRINPHFSTEDTAENRLLDSPELAEMRRVVAAARQTVAEAKVEGLRAGLSDEDGIAPQALAQAYDAPAHLSQLAKGIPGLNGDHVRDRIADGAPRQALELLVRLRKANPKLREGAQGARVERLERELKIAPESPAVSDFYERLGEAKQLLKKGRYGEALSAALSLQESTRSLGLRTGTGHALYLDSGEVADRIRTKGMAWLYGARGKMTSAKLAEHVAALGPANYAGDLLPREPIRIQCYGDCKFQQAYNHPELSLVAEQMPYPSFLRAVESRLDKPDARHEGLMEFDTTFALRSLGLSVIARGAVRDEARLVALLREHGALMATIRFNPPKSVKEMGGNHAVIVQGAFKEDGAWRFVMIDSNHSRPQVMTFDELRIFGASGYHSVEPMKDGDKNLPKPLRGIPDPALRLRKAISLFYGEYGALVSVVPWYKTFFWGVANLARERLGLEPIEPQGREVLDPNLVELSRAPASWRGVKLPWTAFVTAPDGRRFLNRLVVERTLARKS